jgi:aldehyde:ferredoxin oxidoreductase
MSEPSFALLDVDLSNETATTVDVTNDMRKYLGGRGLGAKLLWDRVPKNADPLGPDNILYFGIGPVTPWAGGATVATFKSPLTMLAGRSSTVGRFSREMVYAGYNAGVLFRGKAKNPVYVYVKDEEVEIRDASHLWGSWGLKTQSTLHKELVKDISDQDTVIISIGPAGEHLVRNANIINEWIHSMSRLGCGAVMGSKNLKAVAIRGTKTPHFANPKKLYGLLTRYRFSEPSSKQRIIERRWGHSKSMSSRYYKTMEGVKNKQLGWHEVCDLSNPMFLEQKYKMWTDGCYICTIPCFTPYYRADPPWGPVVGELRHDNAGGFNANTLVHGFDDQMYVSPLCAELGLDAEDVSGVVAWMMECYDRGIVTREELGVDLKWGDVKAICELLKKIAYREGIGDILAEGLKFAPDRIGRGSEQFAMHGKGVAITSYEPRGSMIEAIEMAVSPIGAVHGERGSPRVVFRDSATICGFNEKAFRPTFGSVHKGVAEFSNAVAGWDSTEEEMRTIMMRNYTLERCYSLREGQYVPARDDDLPDRFFAETIYSKYGEPKVLDRDKFLAARATLYSELGLSETGLPVKEKLKELDLEFVIPELASMSLLG